MSNGYNAKFQGDPFALIRQSAVNNVSMAVANRKGPGDFPPNKYGADGRIKTPSPYGAYQNSLTDLKGVFDVLKQGQFDIEPRKLASGTVLYLRYVLPGLSGKMSEPPIRAYWCPYNTEQGVVPSEIPFVDLPKSSPTHNLMLTGSMQGCSLVVTLPKGDPTVLRVYHDFKHKVNSFKDEVVVCRIDYTNELYKSTNSMPPVASATSRPRSMSVGALASPPSGGRARASSVTGSSAAISCVRFSYGDNEQFKLADVGGASAMASGIKLSTAFNFLSFDTSTKKWNAISQPLDFVTSGDPKQAWYEPDFIFKVRQDVYNDEVVKNGQQVGMPAARPPWRCEIPY